MFHRRHFSLFSVPGTFMFLLLGCSDRKVKVNVQLLIFRASLSGLEDPPNPVCSIVKCGC